MFFIVAGPVILGLDCIVDVYWFIKHMYKMDLDKVAKKKKDHSDNAVSVIDRKTLQKVLKYFENQNQGEVQISS